MSIQFWVFAHFLDLGNSHNFESTYIAALPLRARRTFIGPKNTIVEERIGDDFRLPTASESEGLMIFSIRAFAFACAVLGWAPTVNSQEHTIRDWQASKVDDSGYIFCDAITSAPSGHRMGFYTNSKTEVFLWFSYKSWKLALRFGGFIVEVDNRKWGFQGSLGGDSINSRLMEHADWRAFLGAVAQGKEARLYNEENRLLAAFSLRGSYAAMLKMIECMGDARSAALIRQGLEADPF